MNGLQTQSSIPASLTLTIPNKNLLKEIHMKHAPPGTTYISTETITKSNSTALASGFASPGLLAIALASPELAVSAAMA